jgi:L-ascorbate metabolism protein UlaG (beta-lactamase superfamily)
MKLTKYEHSCLDIEEQGQRLIIDPGAFTKSLRNLDNIVGVVVTHIHPDHFNPEIISQIVSKNPSVMIFSVENVSQELTGMPHKTVNPGDREQAGPFFMAFFGGSHATIHESMPKLPNVGVMVNNLLYYPGDSFVKPGLPVHTLALPSSAPWMKISEAMDFLQEIKPRAAFPTHNALLSDIGSNIHDRLLRTAAGEAGSTYSPLGIGESVDINE